MQVQNSSDVRRTWIEKLATGVRSLDGIPVGLVLVDLRTASVVAYNATARALLGEEPSVFWESYRSGDAAQVDRVHRYIEQVAAEGGSAPTVRHYAFTNVAGAGGQPIDVRLWHLSHPEFETQAVMAYLRPAADPALPATGAPLLGGGGPDEEPLFVAVDDDFVVTLIDPAIEQIGFHPDEVVGLSAEALFHPEDRDSAFTAIAQLDEPTVALVEFTARLIDGYGNWRRCDLQLRRIAGEGPRSGYAALVRLVRSPDADPVPAFEDPADGSPTRPWFEVRSRREDEILPTLGPQLTFDTWLSSLVAGIRSDLFEGKGVTCALWVPPSEGRPERLVVSPQAAIVFGFDTPVAPVAPGAPDGDDSEGKSALSVDSQSRLSALVAGLPDTGFASDRLTLYGARSGARPVTCVVWRLRRTAHEPSVYLFWCWVEQPTPPPAKADRWIWAHIDESGRLFSLPRTSEPSSPNRGRLVGSAFWLAVHPDDLLAITADIIAVIEGRLPMLEASIRMPIDAGGWTPVEYRLEMHDGPSGSFLLAGFGLPTRGHTGSDPRFSRLSTRERQIVEAVVEGKRVPTIAREEFLAESTVRNHLSSAFRKLGINSQVELIERYRTFVD